MFDQRNPAFPSNRVRVKRLLLVETGTYNPQYLRGYETQVTGSVINMLSERMAGASKFTPGMFGGIAGQFIRPSAAPESATPIAIPNGWGERRMRFMMEVEIVSPLAGATSEIITGYTENYDGVTMSGTIDRRLMFYINNITELRNLVVPTPMGQQNMTSVANSCQVLVDNNWSGIRQPEQVTRMRPTDVFSMIQRSHLPTTPRFMDTRTVLGSQPVKSRRSNNLATSYASNLVDSYKSSWGEADQFGQGMDQIITNLRGLEIDPLMSGDSFIQAMSGIRCTPPSNMFTYGDLLMLDPNADHDDVKVIVFMGQSQAVTPHHAGQSETWQGADQCTAAAAILSQAVPAIMADMALTQIAFSASNRNFAANFMGEIPVTIATTHIRSFANMDLRQQDMAFQTRMRNEVLNDISYSNSLDYHIEMQVDLLGETRIAVSLQGSPLVEYVTPSFCDSLMAPVITRNEQQARTLAEDFGCIFEHVTSNMVGGTMQPPQYGNF